MRGHKGRRTSTVLSMIVLILSATAFASSQDARSIYEGSGVKGGLVVHLGCGDGEFIASLRVNDRYLVHGLDTNAAVVADTRKLLRSKGVQGPVSVAQFDGQNLPYVRNTVNLVIAEDPGQVPAAEIMRVLAPEGVAWIGGERTVKPRPEEIDEWTHFLHDSGGNSVAEDRRIKSPGALRWKAKPRWCRSHEMPSSVQGVVTSGGRLFTILDEAPTGVFEKLPWKCLLVARDAFNGKLLWKVPLKKWDGRFGAGRGNRWNIHHTLPRRLIADGERVYVTLKFPNSPVSVLDAATGETIVKAVEGTRGADEMVLCDDILVVKRTGKRSPGAQDPITYKALANSLVAVDVKTGKPLWSKSDTHMAPYTLAAKEGRVVYHNTREIVCLDMKTGERHWQTSNEIGKLPAGRLSLVVHDDTVLFHGKKLSVWSLEDGGLLWEHKGFPTLSGACTQPTEVFVTNATVWCGQSTVGLDLKTGELHKRVDLYELISPGHHRRCLRGKATVDYVIRNKRGAEFVDLSGGDNHMRNDWLRSPCFTGATPANGILYVPPSQCFCYPGVKVSGYLAMSSDPVKTVKPSGAEALVKGPAFGNVEKLEIAAGDWPMHRGDNLRSGRATEPVPTDLEKKWEITLDGPAASQPVVVEDRLWIAEKDTHTVRCLNAHTGEDAWSYTAGGPVDSSPTIHDGMVLFGCRDGCVYCLRASDGELVWRFRAAPDERRIVSFEELESLWPVHGSVLVQDGNVYFAAGRSSFLDGGMMVYSLDAKTGSLLNHHVLEGPWPDIKTEKGRPFAMEGALPDLLVSDADQNLYMMRLKFDAELNRQETKRGSDLGELAMDNDHMIATAGFLDDSNFDRIYWMHGNEWPGFHFAQHASKSGQMVVFDRNATYAVKFFYRRYQWSPKFYPGEQGYLVFSDDIDSQPGFLEEGRRNPKVQWLPEAVYQDNHRRGGRHVEKGTGYVSKKHPRWQTFVPTRVRAMLLAHDQLLVAGPPDKVVEGDPLAAFEGRAGAQLRILSAKDGSRLKSMTLDSPPVFDGMSAANGRLYMASENGALACFAK
ncbi:MAG: PQQ-binding-like beta-propeller repeat protein [Planctomycetota bacterium]